MLAPQKIILIGPMGAGKSTIGRLLARLLALPFKDSDAEIEERCGADIPWIFDVEGEEGFRLRETAVLKSLCKESALILATGGGIILNEENRALISQADIVIYLVADIEQLVKRTEKDKKRPLLQVADPEQKIRQLISERDALYREVATRIVMTDARSPKILAKQIAANILS
jgi:shikimate kinase